MCEMGMVSEAVDQFKEFRDSGIFLNKVLYNIVVDALCKLGKLEEAVEMLNEMEGRQTTFRMLLNCMMK